MNPGSIPTFALSSRGIALRKSLAAERNAIVAESIRIQQIAAPTFEEGVRAAYVRDQFRGLGLSDVQTDELHNVYGRLPGHNPALPAVLISAHTDTVFGAQTPLAVQRSAERIVAPGIGDNSLGVAALLALPTFIRPFSHDHDVWFLANSREEGLGDLGGMRAAIDRLNGKIGVCIVLEGMAFGQIYHAGICVRRLRISVSTPGGHSWLHFGQPSAIHSLVRFATQITHIAPPQTPRTTYNIGLIEGGHSVNSIATDAALTLDMRSEETPALAELERAIRGLVDRWNEPGVSFAVEVVGDRPAGAIPLGHPLVHAAHLALEFTGVTPAYRSGSTDANLPLSRGLPAVTVGITSGNNAHRLDEFIDTEPISEGMFQLTLLALCAAGGL